MKGKLHGESMQNAVDKLCKKLKLVGEGDMEIMVGRAFSFKFHNELCSIMKKIKKIV